MAEHTSPPRSKGSNLTVDPCSEETHLKGGLTATLSHGR